MKTMFAHRYVILLLSAVSCISGFQTQKAYTRIRKSSPSLRCPTHIPQVILSSNVSDDDEPDVAELTSTKKAVRDVTFTIFKLFSYCIQFLGAFFFIGLILNFAGYGYTVDLDHGLVIDRIENIRNELQFEREIERESMQASKYLIAPKVPE